MSASYFTLRRRSLPGIQSHRKGITQTSTKHFAVPLLGSSSYLVLSLSLPQPSSISFPLPRNWALPKVAGSTIEGFLENVGSKIPTKVRIYCVLLGPSMLYYQSQEDAIGNAVPLGVTEIHSVGEWDGSTGGLTSFVAVMGGLASQDNGFKVRMDCLFREEDYDNH